MLRIEAAGTEKAMLVTVPVPPDPPQAPPESTKLPLASIAVQCPFVRAPDTVASLVVFPDKVPVVGGEPARIGLPEARAPEDERAELDEK